MEITLLQIVLVFIVACIAGMESVLDEFQFHRPLVACTLIGAVLGDMKTGIIIGGTLEMIALGWMNIGAAVAPDAALASIISTILVIAGHQSIGAGIAVYPFLCIHFFQHQEQHFVIVDGNHIVECMVMMNLCLIYPFR